MRNFSLLGLLIVVAIIAYLAKIQLAPAASHNPNDQSTVEYYLTHDSDRATMLDYCNHHPDQQNSSGCRLAIAAQAQIDTKAATGQSGQNGQTGVDQGTSNAVDQLEAQKDANQLP